MITFLTGEPSFKAFWTIRNAFLKGPSYEAKHIMDDLHEKHGKIMRMWLPGRNFLYSYCMSIPLSGL